MSFDQVSPADNAVCAQDEVQSIDDLVESFRAAHHQPAMAAAVVRSSEIVASGLSGVQSLSTGDLIEAGDLWHMGGASSIIFADAIARLVKQDLLSWDTHILDVFPELRGKMRPEYGGVTLRHLLAHSARAMPFTNSAGQVEAEINNSLTGTPTEKRRQFVDAVLQRQPSAVPGLKFEFSNGGYAIAAAMAEKVTGKSLPVLLEELVFDQCQMASATLGLPCTPERKDQPWGHHLINGRVIAIPPGPTVFLPEILEPANGVSCSVEDLAQFAQIHLKALRGEEIDEPGALDAATIRELHEVVVDRATMGWFTQDVFGSPCHFNRGSVGLFYCWVMIWPDHDLAIVTFSNAGTGEEACRLLAEALFQKYRE